jgi:hypothetical protein
VTLLFHSSVFTCAFAFPSSMRLERKGAICSMYKYTPFVYIYT